MSDGKGLESLQTLKTEIPITPKETPITDLFKKFIDERAHMAILVDAYGNTVGLVTMEDIIETLLGLEIMDETDNVEDLQHLARQNWEKRAKKMGMIKRDEEQ